MFCFRLALALGMTVRQLEQNIGSDELSEWMAFDRVEPLDSPYWRSGMQAATVATVMSGKKYKPEDFMPQRRKPQSALEQIAILKRFKSKE